MCPEAIAIAALGQSLAVPAEKPASDLALAVWELERDRACLRLGPADRLALARQALEVGRRAAQPYLGREVLRVAEAWGVRVEWVEGSNVIAGLPVRSEYDSRTSTITLYRASVRQVQAVLADLLLEPWSLATIIASHVGHELFHHLEARGMVAVDQQLPPAAGRGVGHWLRPRTRVRRCREVAAHAFVREWLNLPFLPDAVDWLTGIVPTPPSSSRIPRRTSRPLPAWPRTRCSGGLPAPCVRTPDKT